METIGSSFKFKYTNNYVECKYNKYSIKRNIFNPVICLEETKSQKTNKKINTARME